jgi:RHS repeat-associated protein
MRPATKVSQRRSFLFDSFSILAIACGILLNPVEGRCSGTVTNLNWFDLDEALSGGGVVRLECDGAIYKPYTSPVSISANTVIDGTGHNVVLNGWSGWGDQMFYVKSGFSLTLSNVTIAGCIASTNGGAILNLGTLMVYDCTFSNNWAQGLAGTNGANGADATTGTAGSGTAGTSGKNGYGGAIYNQGSLVINGGYFLYNAALGGAGGKGGNGGNATTGTPGNGAAGAAGGLAEGGAIFTTNNVTITNCFFAGNYAVGGYGGLGGNGGVAIGTVGNNGVGGIGGNGLAAAIYAYRDATVVNSTFYLQTTAGGNGGNNGLTIGAPNTTGPKGGNSYAGAIFNAGTNSFINCTFAGNVVYGGTGGNGGSGPAGGGGTGGAGGVAWGGGIYSTNRIGLTNCTVAWNAAIGGSGGSGGYPSGAAGADGSYVGANVVRTNGTFTLKNSIFAGGTGVGGNGVGTFVDAGQNISDDNSITLNGTGSQSSTDPKVALDLQFNGGPTPTLALQSGSPAINAADNSVAPQRDQRNFTRVGTADIGAFEYGSATLRVYAAGQIASLDGDVGLFILGGVPSELTPFTANFTISGTASNGVDYVQINAPAVIPTTITNDANYLRIPVRGIGGAFTATNKTVTVTLSSGTNYLIYAGDLVNPSTASVLLSEQSTLDSSKRYDRGTSTAFDFHSFIVPLNFQSGVRLDASGGNATNLFPNNPWTSTLYHFDATNAALQTNITGRIAFQNPIAAFGSPVGGSPLYVNQSYNFGIYAGDLSATYSNALRIQVYYRSNAALAGTISLPVPDPAVSNQLANLVTNGFTQTYEQFGLRTTLLDTPDQRWGVMFSRPYTLTHTATSDAATNYYYVVEEKGTVLFQPLVLNSSGVQDYAKLYVMEFNSFPAGRSMFVDQPHFDGKPLPPAYQGKSLEELTNITATLPDLSSLVPSNYLTLDDSPELRRHPILDQFVQDMGDDPLALANYVINEIGLVDAIDYDTNYNSLPAVNLGGVNRSALATFQEGQGSPVEQCALLVYLLRQAGVPAAYVYPTNGGLQMLDFQASKLLRMQLVDAVSPLGQTNLPHSIAMNYPWVAAYIGSNWVQVFPWMKDTEISEGFNFYDFMPTNYNSGYKWMTGFIAGDTNIFSLSDSDQPFDLLPKFIQKNLNDSHYGLSVDDMGVKLINRKHLYAQWTDFPKPFSLSGTPLVVESLKTNLDLFNTVRIQVFSENDPSKVIDSTELRVADIHNRRFMLKFVQVGTDNVHDMVLSLAPYSPAISNVFTFDPRADTTWKLESSTRLASTDDNIIFKVTHKRLRFLPKTYAAPASFANSNLWGYTYFEQGGQDGRSFVFTDTFRKGDLVAFCMDLGRVTPKMLNVHAQEIWRFNQVADTNQPATIDSDVYLGTTTYLIGMSYFQYVDRFNELNNRLHKMQIVSEYQQGYGLVRPQRDANGDLINGGVVNPITPAIHVPNNGFASVFNQTLHPDSSRDAESARLDWWMQRGVQLSAAEHGILRSYIQTNALSTITLLQQVGTNRIVLTPANYLAEGEVLHNGVKLKDADPATWSKIKSFFGSSDYDAVAYVTPGAVTNGSYVGVGALCVSYNLFAALVSGLNGAYAYEFPEDTFSYYNSPNITVNTAPDDSISYYQLYTAAAANSVNGAVTTWDLFEAFDRLSQGQQILDPALEEAGFQFDQTYGSFVDAASTYDQMYNVGAASSEPSAYNDGSLHASDPVNAMNGEFYIDSVDLSLPGPMPLQIRRNYGSQNLAENEFGFGWKMNYVPFLSVGTNATLIYAVEMDGSALAYRQSTTNANVWMPLPQDNPTLNNNSSLGIGSMANLFNNRLELATVGGTNVYTLTGADGSVRTFTVRSYPIGSFTRERPYLDTWRDHRGNSHSCEYGSDSTQPDYGEVRRIQSSNGNFLGFYYDVYGHIIEAYTGDGRRLYYQYDKYGDLITVTLPDLAEINYEYQHLTQVTNGVTNVYSSHLIVRELKPDGRTLENVYDSERRVTNQLATVGADLNLIRNATFAYTNNFSVTSPTNLLSGVTAIYDYTNRVTMYFYTNGLVRKIVDPLGGTIVQDWYETNSPGGYQRSLKSRTDKRNLLTAYEYDAFGNITNTTVTGDLLGDASGTNAVTSATYNTNNLPLQITDPIGNSISYVYDPNFVFLAQQVITSAGGAAVSTNLSEYVNVTNVVTLGSSSVTNRAFGVMRREIRAYASSDAATNEWFRDGRGFVTNAVQYTGTGDPNVTNQFLYNGRQELVERMDAAGRRHRFAYDDMGRPIARETFEAGQTVPMDWSYSYYNGNGEMTWMDGPRFNPEDYVWRDYDGAGRQTTEIHWRSEANPDGTGVQAPAGDNLYSTRFQQYDPFGNLTKTIDPRGNYSLRYYDAIGQMTRAEFYDANGVLLATNGFAYDSAGDVTNAFDGLGGNTEKQFTSTGKIKFQRNADGSTNAWRYYLDGRIRREIQGNGAFWETTYDDVARKVTRIFYSAGALPLATNVFELDRRGNLARQTDAAGYVFTNLFDGLNRLKISAGPAIESATEDCGTGIPGCGVYVTNVVQQSTTYTYDASGKVLTVANALGEKTITTRDALGRAVSAEIRDTNNVTVRVVTATYSTDHHSVTLTNGSGTGTVVSTGFTDNDGNTVLSVTYPSANVREFTLDNYDPAGNRVSEGRYAATNSAIALFSGAVFEYDGLNRLTSQWDRDDALTTFAYNAAGNVTNRTMPGGLQWNAIYNNAGQMLQEWNLGSGGTAARTNIYAYYPSGNPFAGLLQTNIDARGITCTHYYDDWLAAVTNVYHDNNAPNWDLVDAWQYDVRGFVTNIYEDSVPGGTVTVARSYDAYGQLTSENGVSQVWDAAGRRTGLGFAGFGYSFGWRADGLLAAVGTSAGSATYSYNTAGLLTNRVVAGRTTSVASRDGTGRPLSITTKVNGMTALSESLSYTGDGLLATHTLTRDFTDQRSYDYANLSRRITSERLNLDAGTRWTNTFAYDNGTSGGPGVLTLAGVPGSGGTHWNGDTDTLSRVNNATNTAVFYPAYGRINGQSTVTTLLDSQPVPVRIETNTDSSWPLKWYSVLELTPGAHQLSVTAAHPSGLFTTNANVWFTNNSAGEIIADTFDGAGNITLRLWKNASGQTNRSQGLAWDRKGRLQQVAEVDSNGNGYLWVAVYDGLDRLIMSDSIGVTNGQYVLTDSSEHTIDRFYDPQVEFLELGVAVNGQPSWKLYGPDRSGTYGQFNGVGGLDAVAPPGPGILGPVITDVGGNILGVATNGVVDWNPARVTGYGAVPNYRPGVLGYGANLAQSSAWRGHYPEITGLIYLGARFYDPVSGRFLNSDPMWNGRDPSYYTFCGGDPINYFDPNGRFGKQQGQDSVAELANFLEREFWRSPYAPWFQDEGIETSFPLWLESVLGGDMALSGSSYAFQGDTRSFGARAGTFAADTFLNADAIQQGYYEMTHPDFRSGWGMATWGVGTISTVANTVDAVANAVPVVGTGKAFVENAIKTGIKGIGELFVKDTAKEVLETGFKGAGDLFSRTAGESMEPALFERMKAAFERQGGQVRQGGDVELYLKKMEAEGSTPNAKLIQLRENPSVSAVYEEFIHTAQLRRGRTSTDWIVSNEIEAAEKLIRFRKQYGIPNSQTRQTIDRLRDWRRKQ